MTEIMSSVGVKIITTSNEDKKKNLWDQYTDDIRKKILNLKINRM